MLELGLENYIEMCLNIDTRDIIAKTNQCYVTGKLSNNFEFSHEVNNEKFYYNTIIMTRYSNEVDEIPIIVSEKLKDSIDLTGKCRKLKVAIVGIYRSLAKKVDNGKSHIRSNILVNYIKVFKNKDAEYVDENNVYFEGYICKPTIYRKTNRRRRITDIFIAVNRPNQKKDYIPCIAWGNKALYAAQLQVGEKIKAIGRLQNRIEILEDGTKNVHYEVSITELEKIE